MDGFAREILRETGFLGSQDEPLDGMILPDPANKAAAATRLTALLSRRDGGLAADGVFRVGSTPVVVFKSAQAATEAEESDWHRVAWNAGVAPLLWISTPRYVRLYNAFQPPSDYDGASPLLAEFPLWDGAAVALAEVRQACGRQTLALGGFWKSSLARKIDRRQRVDSVLLDELGALLARLTAAGLKSALSQKLVGRCIFFQYLVHRGYLAEDDLKDRFGAGSLHDILADLDQTYGLFRWIRKTFNGDLFPIEDEPSERAQIANAQKLAPLADFFGHFSLRDRQGRLFPFRFDVIPVELISSIYEKFVHMADTDGAPRQGVHYTPINLVDLTLDPVFEGVDPHARVLDPACGSGVFLVESLRRLVWLRAAGGGVDQTLVRDVLMHQIRGVDISPAALSVAAFSLYLALLELDPRPPLEIGGLESLKFEPLHGRVLFHASTFDPGLDEAFGEEKFDVVVGNPPWTYRAEEKREDQVQRKGGTPVRADMSGTTYARLRKRTLPPRSPDWAFLWRALDFAHPRTRIALIMKATPFLSQDAKVARARDVLLRSLPNVTLVNLSQLRIARLFQEYDAGDADGGRKPTAGPALIFYSNVLPSVEGEVGLVNLPWSSTFGRTGVFEPPADGPRRLRLDLATAQPGLLKATLFGTERDAWFLERLSRRAGVKALKTWAADIGLALGQGFQAGDTMPADHLEGLPVVSAVNIAAGVIAGNLEPFLGRRAHRGRSPEIFKGPLVLLPEGALTRSPALGRYTAAFDKRDLAYTESFVGVSFAGRDPRLAQAFAGLMHSALVTYQLALCGGTVGVKQTKIEAVDLYATWIPCLEKWPEMAVIELASGYERLVQSAVTRGSGSEAALRRIDDVIADQLRLSEADRELLSDVTRRSAAILFETEGARAALEAHPTASELAAYANALCGVFNGTADEPDDLRLHAAGYTRYVGDLVAVRLRLDTADWTPAQWDGPGPKGSALGGSMIQALHDAPAPYVEPTRTFRLYADDTLIIVKPARYRCFTPATGQNDADQIAGDLMMQAAAEDRPG